MRLNEKQFITSAAVVVFVCIFSARQLRENDTLLGCSCGQPAPVSALPVLGPGAPQPDYVFIGDINSTCSCGGQVSHAVVNVVLPTHDQLALQSLGISVGKQLAANQLTIAKLDGEIKRLPLRFSRKIPSLSHSMEFIKDSSRQLWLVHLYAMICSFIRTMKIHCLSSPANSLACMHQQIQPVQIEPRYKDEVLRPIADCHSSRRLQGAARRGGAHVGPARLPRPARPARTPRGYRWSARPSCPHRIMHIPAVPLQRARLNMPSSKFHGDRTRLISQCSHSAILQCSQSALQNEAIGWP
jgi:hypothetical protein